MLSVLSANRYRSLDKKATLRSNSLCSLLSVLSANRYRSLDKKATAMKADNKPVDEISELTGLPVDDIEKL